MKDEAMKDEAEKILKSMEIDKVDGYFLGISFNSKKIELLNFLNRDKLPENLEYLLIKMTVIDYIDLSYKNKTLPDSFDLSAAVRSIRVGDTEVNYAREAFSDADNILSTIKSLKEQWRVEALPMRRLKW